MGEGVSARRADRVAGVIRAHLTELLGHLGDERLSTLVVTDLSVTDDLSVARVFVRSLAGPDDPQQQKSLLRALSRVSGRLRRGLAPRLDLRKLPELRFEYDRGHDNVRRVDELLEEIAHEDRERADED